MTENEKVEIGIIELGTAPKDVFLQYARQFWEVVDLSSCPKEVFIEFAKKVQ